MADTPTDSSLMQALEVFEAAEANLVKLERLWDELQTMIPGGISFGENIEYEDRQRSYTLLLASLPMLDGWKPTAEPYDLDTIAQNRLDAAELGEFDIERSVERSIADPGRELREYRFRFNNTRKALIRDALVGLIDAIDDDLRTIRAAAGADPEHREQLDDTLWADLRDHAKQVEVLLGSSVKRPARWSDMRRHMRFGYPGDLHDIENADWPQVKAELRKGLYGVNEAVPVKVADLSSLVAARPTGPISTALAWSAIDDATFERLLFALISNEPGYENPGWLMNTNAADRGRDLSVDRVIEDPLTGTLRQRVILQCKHWTTKSVGVADVATLKEQMKLWDQPVVTTLIIATSGRFSADAVLWIDKHNATGEAPRIEMWAESHLERLLSARPALIAEFGLRKR
jgi:hypothetical protein